MNFKNIATKVTSTVGRQVLKAKKESPSIMFGAGVVGIVGTVVLASKATLELDSVLEASSARVDHIETAVGKEKTDGTKYTDSDRESDLRLNKIKTAGQIGRLYAPAAVLGVVSIGLLTGAHVALKNRNTALMAAYAAVDTAFKEYRARVIEDQGEDKDLEYRFGTAEREVYSEGKKGEPKVEYIKTYGDGASSMYSKLFDEFNKNWNPTPEFNLFFLRGQQNYLNDLLQVRGHVLLNDVYDALGMERTTPGMIVGWMKDAKERGAGDGYIDFGIWSENSMERMHDFMVGNEQAILLDFNVDGVIYNNI